MYLEAHFFCSCLFCIYFFIAEERTRQFAVGGDGCVARVSSAIRRSGRPREQWRSFHEIGTLQREESWICFVNTQV